MKMSTLGYITWILVIVGALNWGLVGAFNYNFVGAVFGMGVLTQWIYIFVGLSGVYALWKILTMKKK